MNNTWSEEQKGEFLDIVASDSCFVVPGVARRPGPPQHFRYEEFMNFLASRNLGSSPGLDLVSYEFILNLSPEDKYKFFTIICDIWNSTVIPEIWKDIRISTVPKRDNDASRIENYRSISLLCVPLKCLEDMLKTRIQRHVESNNMLPARSYAFRSGRSTSMCINDLINRIYHLKSMGFHVLGFCVDVERAYDCVDVSVLEGVLLSFGIDASITVWIVNFLRRRNLCFGDQRRVVGRGLAQGSGLSPILFNLYSSALHDISSQFCDIFQFADDFFIVIHHRVFETAKSLLHSKIEDFKDKCADITLSFNPSKTNTIHFNRRSRELNLSCDGVPINHVDSIKYLDLFVTSNFSSNAHTEYMLSQVDKKCKFLTILRECRFGIDPRKSLRFYKSFVTSRIEYGSAALANSSKVSLNKIGSCMNGVLRKTLGLIRSTPVPIIYHLAAEMPPSYRFEFSTANEIIKCWAYALPVKSSLTAMYHPINTGISRIYFKYKDIFSEIGGVKSTVNKAANIHIYKDFFKGSMVRKSDASPDLVNRLFSEKMALCSDGGFESLFTGGSVMTDWSGAAFIHVGSGIACAFYDDKLISSMSAELIAIMEAIEYSINNGFLKISIFSDSLSGSRAFDSNSRGNFIIDRINLLAVDFGGEINLHYIPGHSGIRLKDIADQAAKRAKEIGSRL